MDLYKPATSGERLFRFIYDELRREPSWRSWSVAIRQVGNPEELGNYYQHHASLLLACKLISAGKSLSDMDDENSGLVDTIIEGFPWSRINSGGRLSRLLVKAIQSSGRPISKGAKREMLSFAKSSHTDCYICGTALDFSTDSERNSYTAEHLWPSSYGGDSTEENLLPACYSCNGKKGGIVTWVSTDVHTLFLGLNPSTESLERIPFAHRYGLFHQAAMSYATKFECTLKQAFRKIGPWIEAYSLESSHPTDMFNIKTHQSQN